MKQVDSCYMKEKPHIDFDSLEHLPRSSPYLHSIKMTSLANQFPISKVSTLCSALAIPGVLDNNLHLPRVLSLHMYHVNLYPSIR